MECLRLAVCDCNCRLNWPFRWLRLSGRLSSAMREGLDGVSVEALRQSLHVPALMRLVYVRTMLGSKELVIALANGLKELTGLVDTGSVIFFQ